MFDLMKISELLKKGTENPAIQNKEGKFSVLKWRKEIQPYTEPFLEALVAEINKSIGYRNDLWKNFSFKTLKKYQGKQRRLGSLQDALLKLPEQFSVLARKDEWRVVEAFIMIAPSPDTADGGYTEDICWGLRWWGTRPKAEIVYGVFDSMNFGSNYRNLVFKDGGFGSSAWLFNHVGREELLGKSFDELSEILVKDFNVLFSILLEHEWRFPPNGEDGDVEKLNKNHVEFALRRITSRTGLKKVNKADVVNEIESLQEKGILSLKSTWRRILDENVEEWFK